MRKNLLCSLWSHQPENVIKGLVLPYSLFSQNTFWKTKKSYSNLPASAFGSAHCSVAVGKITNQMFQRKGKWQFSQEKFPNERCCNCNCYITFSCDFFFFSQLLPCLSLALQWDWSQSPPHTKVCFFRRTPAHAHKAWKLSHIQLNNMLATFHSVTTPTPAQYCVLIKLCLSIIFFSSSISLEQHLKEISFGSFLLGAYPWSDSEEPCISQDLFIYRK